MKGRSAIVSLQPGLPAGRGPARHEPAPRPRVPAAAAAAMWLLFLGTLLAVAASTKLISKRSWEPRSMMSPCGLDEYPSASNCCRRCPAGQYVREPCSSTHTQSECATCDEGTFTAFPNDLRSCLLCSSCSEDQEVVAECTPSSNRKCQCQTGRYLHPDSDEFCAPCSPCPQGKVVLRTCNATADTVCGLPGPGLHGRHHVLVLGGCLFSVTVAIIFFCFRKSEDREDETVYHSLQNGDCDGQESVVSAGQGTCPSCPPRPRCPSQPSLPSRVRQPHIRRAMSAPGRPSLLGISQTGAKGQSRRTFKSVRFYSH
ncbi:tumor necrosis factor receptor superfamily member 25-like isoform 1-T1 [Molossus nigricans]